MNSIEKTTTDALCSLFGVSDLYKSQKGLYYIDEDCACFLGHDLSECCAESIEIFEERIEMELIEAERLETVKQNLKIIEDFLI